MDISKGHKEPTERPPDGQSKKKNKIALRYNPRYRINTHESTLI